MPVITKTLRLQMLAASRCALAILLAMTTKVTQISLMVWVALGKHQIAELLLEHPFSVRSEKETAMAENSLDWCWCARCTKTLSKSGFKHANCFLSLTKCQYIPASVPSSISWMNECKMWGNDSRQRNVDYLIKMLFVIIIHQGLENIEIFSSRPRLFQDQDQDHFSCSRGASRPRPRSRDYISAFLWEGNASPSYTMWPGLRLTTSVSSGILMHPAV